MPPGTELAVQLTAAPDEDKQRWAAARAVAMGLSVSLAEASALLDHLPARYPLRWTDEPRARAALDELAAAGLVGSLQPAAPAARCRDHLEHEPPLWADVACVGCEAPLCSLCSATSREEPRCKRCSAKARRSRGFYVLRVSVLLSILVAVLLYAYNDVRRRQLRTDWTRTLTISLVVLPEGDVDAEALTALEQRTIALEQRLTEEMARYRSGPVPFDLLATVVPHGQTAAPPTPPADPSDWWAALTYTIELSRWVDAMDEHAGLGGAAYDASIYLIAKDGDGASTLTVEGIGQQGGRVGVVEVDLTEQMVDSTLFVVAHELFHILGATDKYDASGEPRMPEGLADPDQSPLYPQRRAEIMARHRATSASASVLPESLDELAVGPATAAEIRWSR